MTMEHFANLKGPQGASITDAAVNANNQLEVEFTDRGNSWREVVSASLQGEQGIPGMDAVPADEAVAAYINASESASNTAVSDRVREQMPFVNVRSMGAIGDGFTDDAPAIQAAINAVAPTGGVVLLPVGRYVIGQTLELSSNTVLRGEGAVLDYRSVPKVGSARYGVRATGSLGTARPLTSNVVRGAAFASMDTTGINARDWVLVSTTGANRYPYGGSTLADRGEIKQARSVSPTAITFDQAMYDSYAVSNSASAAPINFVENIAIEGIHFVGSDLPAEGERAIQLDYVNGFRISGCVIEGTDIYCVQLNSCIRGEVSGNRMTGAHYDGTTGTVFYAVSVMNACQWVRVADNHAERVRHLFVTSSTSAGDGHWGMPRFITCIGNIAQNMQGTSPGRSWAYEHHGFGDAILIVGNIADGCFGGFAARGPGVTFEANIVRNWWQHGMEVHSDTVDARNIIIRNNQISDRIIAGGGGTLPSAIRIALANATTVRNVMVVGNAIEADTSADSGAGAIHVVGGTTEGGVSVEDNVISWVGSGPATSWLIRSTHPGTAISGNRLRGNIQRGIRAFGARSEVSNNTVISTTQQTTGEGIWVDDADCIVQANRLSGTYYGVRAAAGAVRMVLHSNVAASTVDPFYVSDQTGLDAKVNVWQGGETAINN